MWVKSREDLFVNMDNVHFCEVWPNGELFEVRLYFGPEDYVELQNIFRDKISAVTYIKKLLSIYKIFLATK